MNEQSFRYGENNLGLGIACLPKNSESAPVLVLLNAGLLHREQPYRLNVLLSRALANLGYICIRVDLAGKGDSPARSDLPNRESVATDWRDISEAIEKQFGERTLLILGLCSGADNAIKLAGPDPKVRGLILLDPLTPKDKNFTIRRLSAKLRNVHVWRRHLRKLLTLGHFRSNKSNIDQERISLRDPPTDADTSACFDAIVERKGRALAIYTSIALPYYNDPGQLVRSLEISGLDECCTEVFWPHMGHLFPAQHHRERLIHTIVDWAGDNLEQIRTPPS